MGKYLKIGIILFYFETQNRHLADQVQNIGGGGGGKGERGAKLFAGCKLIGAPAPNQSRIIITFLTLKTDNIGKLRIELKSILLEIPSNKNKRYIYQIVLL